MIVDDELDEIERLRRKKELEQEESVAENGPEVHGEDGVAVQGIPVLSATQTDGAPPSSVPVAENGFSDRMNAVKLKILQDASAEDEKFVKTIKGNVKEAAVANTEVEREREEYLRQSVQYEREKLSTRQQRNAIEATEDRWANKEKRREFHYNGVKPIMEFVGIQKPMNLFLLYFLSFILVWFFLLSKLWRGTVGALIAGAEDSNRPKTVKGFLWTLLALIAVCILAALVYLFLKWQGIV